MMMVAMMMTVHLQRERAMRSSGFAGSHGQKSHKWACYFGYCWLLRHESISFLHRWISFAVADLLHECGTQSLKIKVSLLCTVNLQKYLHPVRASIPRLILPRAGRRAKGSSAGYMYIFFPAPITHFAQAILQLTCTKLHIHQHPNANAWPSSFQALN
jgi:hypothetical protein